MQVTGRAGRGDKAGRGLLQTYQPQHPVIAAMLAGDQARFYAEEIAARRAAGLPPFAVSPVLSSRRANGQLPNCMHAISPRPGWR